jgi:hypothetical protein
MLESSISDHSALMSDIPVNAIAWLDALWLKWCQRFTKLGLAYIQKWYDAKCVTQSVTLLMRIAEQAIV